MPIYAYRCASCGFEKDVLQKLSDAPLVQCPQCGKDEFRKQVTAAGFQLKGSGWYVTDFRGGNNAKANAPGEPAAAQSGAGESAGDAGSSGSGEGESKGKTGDKAAASTGEPVSGSGGAASAAPSAASSGSASSAGSAAKSP